MGKIRDLKGLIGRVEIGINRENGFRFEVEGLSIVLTLALLQQVASILNCTFQ